MTEAKISGINVELFDSIDELPIKRFHKYNKALLVDSGVGSDLRDINGHISKIIAYIDAAKPKNIFSWLSKLIKKEITLSEFIDRGKREEESLRTSLGSAVKELDNLRQNMILVSQELSPKHLAFAALVKSMDGKDIIDISDTNLDRIRQRLGNAKKKTLDIVLDSVKKKLNSILIYISLRNLKVKT